MVICYLIECFIFIPSKAIESRDDMDIWNWFETDEDEEWPVTIIDEEFIKQDLKEIFKKHLTPSHHKSN